MACLKILFSIVFLNVFYGGICVNGTGVNIVNVSQKSKDFPFSSSTSRHISVPIIDEKLNIEIPDDSKFGDIPVGSADLLWKSVVANDVGVPTGDLITNFEGSGAFTPVKENTTQSPSCNFDKECDSSQLREMPRKIRLPQASDVMVTCMSTSCDGSFLSWYLTNNDSQLVLLHAAEADTQINLTLSQAVVPDSGVYRCVKYGTEFCCHVDVELVIYELPEYENHVLIIGIVAVLFLVTCLVLVVWRNYKNENYKKRSKKLNENNLEFIAMS